MLYSFSGVLPMFVTLCHVPAGMIIAKSSNAGWLKYRLSLLLPICTKAWPSSMRKNWSTCGWTSKPISSPAGMFINVSCKWLPVHKAARKLPLCFVALCMSTTNGFGPKSCATGAGCVLGVLALPICAL